MLQIAQGTATTPRRSPPSKPDPAFAAIQAHIDAMNAFSRAVERDCRLQDDLPHERRTWHPIHGQENRRAPSGCQDAPEWIASQIHYWKMIRADNASLRKFLRCKPTTLEGALAMLEHAGSMPYPEERGKYKQTFGHFPRSDTQTVMHEAFIDEDTREAANGFHSMIAAVLRELI